MAKAIQNYAEYARRRDTGATDADLITEGWHKLTVNRHAKKHSQTIPQTEARHPHQAPVFEDDEADTVIDVSTPVEQATQAPASTKKVRGISPKTVGWICAAGFMYAANRAGDETWLLTDAQQKMLGDSGSEALAIVPAPIASLINDYAGPAVFVTCLLDVIKTKKDRIDEKARIRANQLRNASPVDTAFTVPPPPVDTAPDAGATNGASNGKTGVTEPETLGHIFH